MAFERQQAAALRLLEGLEDGSMSAADSFSLVDEADAALVYLIFTWIRKRYEKHPNADAVVARLLAVIQKSPSVSKKLKEGQQDPVVQWFEEEQSYQSLPKREFIECVVEKLEG